MRWIVLPSSRPRGSRTTSADARYASASFLACSVCSAIAAMTRSVKARTSSGESAAPFGRDRFAVRDGNHRTPRTPDVEAGLRPPILRAPDPDGDDGRSCRERDPSGALATSGQARLRLRIDRSLREDAGERSVADRLDRHVEGALIALTAADGDLTVQPERPSEADLPEELRRHQEPGHPPAARARGEREDDAVKRRHVVGGHDRGSRRGNAVGPLDAGPERDPPEEADARRCRTTTTR